MSIAGLILAAGASTRMGRPKALLELRGETFLDRLIGAFSSVCAPVIVVLGHGAQEIRAGLERAGSATFVLNTDYAKGQLSSLQRGLSAVSSEPDGVMFTPVDYPAIRASTVAKLAARFEQRKAEELFVVPRHQGKRGHPVCCTRAVIAEFLALPSDAQARDIVRKHRDRTCYVDLDDPGILEDADDPEAYRRLLGTAGEL